MASASTSLVSPSRSSQQLLSPSSIEPSLSVFRARMSIGASPKPSASPRIVCCSVPLPSVVAVSNGRPDGEQREIQLGLPSKGRMADNTLGLLKWQQGRS